MRIASRLGKILLENFYFTVSEWYCFLRRGFIINPPEESYVIFMPEGVLESTLHSFRLCDSLTLKYLNGGILYCQIAAKPCSQQFWNFVQDSMMLSRHPIRYNNAGLSRAPFPRKLEAVHPWADSSSVSSSSENVSPKGTKFEEDTRTYSSKASRIVSQTFGDNNDAEWSDRFLNRELFVKDLTGWCGYHGKGGEYAHDTIRPAIREKIQKKKRSHDAAQKLGKTAYLCDSHVQDPSHVSFIIVTYYPVETDDPIRPSQCPDVPYYS